MTGTKGIPFLWRNYYEEGEIKSLELNVFSKIVHGDSKGLDITGISKEVFGDSKGLDITGIAKFVHGDSKGLDITGLYKEVHGDSKGLDITGGYNYSKSVDDYLIQISLIGNKINELEDDACGLQIGLYNRAGNQISPIVNIYGLKNLPGKLKKLIPKKWKKKKLEECIGLK